MRARVLITACVTGALCACAPSFASQGPEDALRDLLAAHAGIVQIDVTNQSVEVVVDDQGTYTRVVATPDWGTADVYESPWTPGTSGYVPSVAAATFDVDDLMTRVNDLARRCESWTTSTVAINDQATTTLAYCGNEMHQSLNGVDLRPLPTVWSQGAFLQLWDEFAVVAPDGEVPIVRIDSQEVYTAIPQPDGLCAQSHVRLVEWGAMGTRGCGASGSQPAYLSMWRTPGRCGDWWSACRSSTRSHSTTRPSSS